jgi:DNA-binding transcriptional MerR regulator
MLIALNPLSAADFGIGTVLAAAKKAYANKCEICNVDTCRKKKIGQFCKNQCQSTSYTYYDGVAIKIRDRQKEVFASKGFEGCVRAYNLRNENAKREVIKKFKNTNNSKSKMIIVDLYTEHDASVFQALLEDLFQSERGSDEAKEKYQLLLSFTKDVMKRLIDTRLNLSAIDEFKLKRKARKYKDMDEEEELLDQIDKKGAKGVSADHFMELLKKIRKHRGANDQDITEESRLEPEDLEAVSRKIRRLKKFREQTKRKATNVNEDIDLGDDDSDLNDAGPRDYGDNADS